MDGSGKCESLQLNNSNIECITASPVQFMAKKIKSKRYGIVHCMAQCQECNWEDAIFSEKCQKPSDVRNEASKHIRQTGHSVHVETGISTSYFLVK